MDSWVWYAPSFTVCESVRSYCMVEPWVWHSHVCSITTSCPLTFISKQIWMAGKTQKTTYDNINDKIWYLIILVLKMCKSGHYFQHSNQNSATTATLLFYRHIQTSTACLMCCSVYIFLYLLSFSQFYFCLWYAYY